VLLNSYTGTTAYRSEAARYGRHDIPIQNEQNELHVTYTSNHTTPYVNGGRKCSIRLIYLNISLRTDSDVLGEIFDVHTLLLLQIVDTISHPELLSLVFEVFIRCRLDGAALLILS
jgi:hypothetical protein